LTKKLTNFRIDDHLLKGMEEIRERDGIPVSEQVRRAISAWLTSKDVAAKPERKRAATRKRS
jgi:hypothetical protein